MGLGWGFGGVMMGLGRGEYARPNFSNLSLNDQYTFHRAFIRQSGAKRIWTMNKPFTCNYRYIHFTIHSPVRGKKSLDDEGLAGAEALKVHNHLVHSAATLGGASQSGSLDASLSQSGSPYASLGDTSSSIHAHETNGESSAAAASAVAVEVEPEGRKKNRGAAVVVVVLGWRRSIEMVMLITSLDDRLPKGYVSTLLTFLTFLIFLNFLTFPTSRE